MKEVLNTVGTNLSPEMLAGNAALALALIPVQYLVDVGKKQMECFVNKILPYQPEKVFYEAFLNVLQKHKKQHDYTANNLVNKLIKQLKKDKNRFYNCINTWLIPQALTQSAESFPIYIFTEKICAEYELSIATAERELLSAIIRDCMDEYRQTLYRLMNEKDLLVQTLQVLIDLQDRATVFEALLSNTATQSDIIVLKDALLTAMHREDVSSWQTKSLEDYDQMIEGQYRYIEFTAGFSPRINARDIRMKMSDVFINLECAYQSSKYHDFSLKQDFDLATLVLHNRFNVFLGDPGCGKTTLLKKIAFDLSSSKNRTTGALSNFIPLYFRMADYSRFYQNTQKGLAEYLQQFFFQFRYNFFDIAQRERSIIFLMDGLDEIADTPLRFQVVEQVNAFVFANPQYIYFITSRIVGYQDAALNGIFSTYRLEPLNDEKIEKFILQWHLAVEENTDDEKSDEDKYAVAEKHTKNLIDAIEKNDSVKRLATNPLLLTIITLIHLQGGRLPNKRVELYDICADTFLQHWINRRVENADAILDRDVLVELLSRVAFYIHENYDNGLIPEDDFQQKFLQYYQELSGDQVRALTDLKKECRQFIDFIRQETGIFAEKGQDEEGRNLFGFLHLTFEEYFAAIDFKRRVAQNVRLMKNYIFSPRWHEIILLCAALFGGQTGTGRDEASRFVSKILCEKGIFPPMHQNLRLVLRIMADDVRLTVECERNIWQQLEIALQTETHLELIKELDALSMSAVYKETFYEKIAQWLAGEQTLCINTIRILFYLSHDPIWHQNLSDAIDNPNFNNFFDWYSISYNIWSNISNSDDIMQKLTEKIVKYLNKYSKYDNIKVQLLYDLSRYCFDHYNRLEEKLVSYEDRLVLCSFLIAAGQFDNPTNVNIYEEKLEQFASAISLFPIPQPIITIYNKLQCFEKQMFMSGSWSYAIPSADGIMTYQFLIEYGLSEKDRQEIYRYTVIDFFLKEIKIGAYNVPLAKTRFIKEFGLGEKSISSNALDSFLEFPKHKRNESLIENWERGNLEFWYNFLENDFPSKKLDNTFIKNIRQWKQSHGQESPIQLLLAQMILNRYDSKKKFVSRKVLRNAIAYYMGNSIPEEQHRAAYKIIKYAIETQETK